MAKIQSHKIYQIININYVPTKTVQDKQLLKNLDTLLGVFYENNFYFSFSMMME